MHDERIDDALQSARAERRDRERRAGYGEAESLALSILPLVPVVSFRSHLAVQPYVAGFAMGPLGLYDVAAMRLVTPETPVAGPTAPATA